MIPTKLSDSYSTPKWLMSLFETWFDPCPFNPTHNIPNPNNMANNKNMEELIYCSKCGIKCSGKMQIQEKGKIQVVCKHCFLKS